MDNQYLCGKSNTMADRVKIVDIKINIDDAINKLAQYDIAIERQKKNLKILKEDYEKGQISQNEYARSTEGITYNMKAYQNASRNLSNSLQQYNQTVHANEGSLKQLRNELKLATEALETMSRAERNGAKGQELRAHIASLKQELNSAATSAETLYSSIADTEEAEGGFSDLLKSAKGFFAQMAVMAVGGSMIGLSKEIIQTTRNFEDGMARVRSVCDPTAEELERLRQVALDLGATTRYTATQAANAEENLVRNGLSAMDAANAVGPSLMLAQANVIDLAEAADIVTNNMNRFGLSVENIPAMLDILSSTAAHSATTVSGLDSGLRNAAPDAHALGIGIQEVAAALGTMANMGIKNEDAGTKMKQFFTGLTSGTPKATAAMKAYGLEIDQTTIAQEGLQGTLEKLSKSGVGKDLSALNDIFGSRARTGALVLINSFQKFVDLNETLSNAGGENFRMFKQAYSDLSNGMYGVEAAWEHLQITAGGYFAGGLIEPMEKFHEGMIWISNNFPQIMEVVKAAIASVSFLKLASAAKSSFTSMKASATTNAMQASQAVQTNINKVSLLNRQEATLENQLNAQRSGSVKATAAEIQLTETKLATVKQQKAIAAANTAKLQATEVAEWNKAKALTVSSSWKAGFAAAGIAARAFVGTCKTVFKGFIVTALISLAYEWLMKLWDAFNSGEGVIGRFGNWCKNIAGKAIDWLVGLCKTLWDWLKSMNNQFHVTGVGAAVFGTALAAIIGIFKSVMSIVKMFVKNFAVSFQTASNIASSFAKLLKDAFSLDFDAVKKDLSEIGQNITKGLTDGIANVKTLKDELKANINEAVSDIADTWDSNVLNPKVKVSKSTEEQLLSAEEKEKKNKEIEALKPKSPEEQRKAAKDAEAAAQAALDKAEKAREIAEKTGDKADKQKADELMKKAIEAAEHADAISAVASPAKDELKMGNAADEKAAAAAAKKAKAAQDKADREAKKRAELENKYLDEAEKAQLALLEETWEKKRAATEQQYDAEIKKLKTTLATEKNLTAKARDAINSLIISKEKQKQRELAKLTDDELKDTVSRAQRLVDARLAIVKKGSEQEYKLQKQKRALEKQSSLNDLDTERETKVRGVTQSTESAQKSEKQAKADLSNATHANGTAKVVVTVDDTALQKAYKDAKKKYEEVVAQWSVVINDSSSTDAEKQAATKAKDEATSEYVTATNDLATSKREESKKVSEGSTSVEEDDYAARAANLAKALQNEANMVQYYADLENATREKYRQDDLVAEQTYQDKLRAKQEKAAEDRIALLQKGYDDEKQTQLTDAQSKYEESVRSSAQQNEVVKAALEKRSEYFNALLEAQRLNEDGQHQELVQLRQREYDESSAEYDKQKALAEQKETEKDEALNGMRQIQLDTYKQQEEEKRNLETLGLDVVTNTEMQALQAQANLDQQRYEQVVERGRLENQTEEEYQQELQGKRDQAAKSQEAVNAAEVKNEQAKGQAFKSVGQNMISMIDTLGESNEAFAKLSKIITLAQIAIDTGKALSAGIASASSLPYPANLAAIATTVATVLANVATAISTVKSAKFAEGGKVIGPGTGTSDSIPAQLSNGEYVMTAKATKMFEPLLAAMNGIGAGVPMQVNNSYRDVENPTTMTDSFTAAAQEIRPVVSVEEITDAQKRVETIQNTDNF